MSSAVGAKRRSAETLDYEDSEKAKRRRAADEDATGSRSSSAKPGAGSGAGSSSGSRTADGRESKGKARLDDEDAEDDGGGAAGRHGDDDDDTPDMRSRILGILAKNPDGLAVKSMAKRLGTKPELVADQLGELVAGHRIEVLRQRRPDGSELQIMRAVSRERAEKLKGLAMEEMAVLAIIERSGGAGVWSRSLKMASKMQQAALNKILKRLEARKLVKHVASVAFKNRRMYMSYDATPSKEVTGGVWYNEASLDTEFITSVKKEAMKAVTALGSRATPRAVAERLKGLGVAGSGARGGAGAGAGDADGASSSGGGTLAASDVAQLLDSLVYEGWLDYAGSGPWRVGSLGRAERATFPSRRLLIDEKVGKKKPGKGAVEFDDDDEVGDGGAGFDDGAGGDGDPSERVYVVVRKSLAHQPAHADHLTSVPCGTCPVMASCKPGGIVSPETCVYMSHWLQW